MELTREYLLWLFHYDRENGKLYWKNHWCAKKVSRIKGKEIHLGFFDTAEEAHQRYLQELKVRGLV